MASYHIVALLLVLIAAAVLLIIYVHLTVDQEFRNLARADSDQEYRREKLVDLDRQLEGRLPLPEQAAPSSKPLSAAGRALPSVLLAVVGILLWGGFFAREAKSTWLYAGLTAMLLAVGIMLALIINWNVDIGAMAYTRDNIPSEDADNAIALDSDSIEEVDEDVEQIDSEGMEKLGSVYFDEATGKYYIIAE